MTACGRTAPRAPQDAAAETATVAGLTHEGEGVVRGGKTVFVTGALPGERIRFRRLRRHRQHDDGELLEVLELSPARVTPECPHFGVCGGCVLQHLEPAAQLLAKEQQLKDTLAHVARVAPARWLPPLAGPAWGYRRRARLGAKYVHRKGRVVVGFRERVAPYVADLKACRVLATPSDLLIEPLAELLTGLTIRERVPQIELAVGDDATALVLRVLESPPEQDLACLRSFAARHGLRLYLQPAGPGSVTELTAGAPDSAGGAAPLHYALERFGLTLGFAPTDFIQVNAPVNQALVARAVELLAPGPDSRVLDVYCGIGNFTLALARSAGSAVGVEGEPALVSRARANAVRNSLGNVEFHVADLAAAPDAAAAWLREPCTHVLLDPPRTGARAVLAAVAQLAPQRILYVSCHPGSLARDLEVLVHEQRFALVAAGVVDMFPHTSHVESVALLERA
ncbi:MAG: 23S rRNA (uracil(1939)-C(5))-methyltransferase RlmD [Steroidobacteraceae bacterium]